MSSYPQAYEEPTPDDLSTNTEATENPIKLSWARVGWEIVKHPFESGLTDLLAAGFFIKSGFTTGDRVVAGLATGLLSFGAFKLKRFTYMHRHEGPYPLYYGLG